MFCANGRAGASYLGTKYADFFIITVTEVCIGVRYEHSKHSFSKVTLPCARALDTGMGFCCVRL